MSNSPVALLEALFAQFVHKENLCMYAYICYIYIHTRTVFMPVADRHPSRLQMYAYTRTHVYLHLPYVFIQIYMYHIPADEKEGCTDRLSQSSKLAYMHVLI